ncbi:MAG: amino acid permease [Rhizomicrobium sp.]|nr:amino acid permease [Rhizomicrobium sp.]
MAQGDEAALTEPEPVIAELKLKRALGPTSLIMIGIGSIVGAGIFVYAGHAAAANAGPAVLISFAIAGFGCLFAGLCYAEFASMIPESGSSYTYAYATMGRFMAWFIGWNMVLEYGVSASGVAAGWSGYFLSFLQHMGIAFPAAFANAPLEGHGIGDLHLTGAIINLPAVVLIVALTALLVVGVRETARFNNAMVLLKVGIVLMLILFGLPYVTAAHFTPFIPPNTGQLGHFGISGIFAGAAIAFFAFIGFEAVSVSASECKNPQRDLPIGILGSLAVCTVLYILIAVVLIGITDWRTLDVPDPMSFAVSKVAGLKWLVQYVNIAAMAGLGTVVFTSLYGQTRVFYSMARDGFLPPAFSAVHKTFHTPHRGTIIVGVVAALLAAIFPFDVLADLVSIGTLLAFIAVCTGIMILRITTPKAPRSFRTPFVWLVAPAGIAVCGVMMFFLSDGTKWRLVIWTALGLVIYFAYGIWHAAPWKWKVSNGPEE